MSCAPKEEPAKLATPGNFVRAAIERDLEAGTYANRRFGGTPGDAAHHAAGQIDPARIRTRFPPEPNGYLHVGHALFRRETRWSISWIIVVHRTGD